MGDGHGLRSGLGDRPPDSSLLGLRASPDLRGPLPGPSTASALTLLQLCKLVLLGSPVSPLGELFSTILGPAGQDSGPF